MTGVCGIPARQPPQRPTSASARGYARATSSTTSRRCASWVGVRRDRFATDIRSRSRARRGRSIRRRVPGAFGSARGGAARILCRDADLELLVVLATASSSGWRQRQVSVAQGPMRWGSAGRAVRDRGTGTRQCGRHVRPALRAGDRPCRQRRGSRQPAAGDERSRKRGASSWWQASTGQRRVSMARSSAR